MDGERSAVENSFQEKFPTLKHQKVSNCWRSISILALHCNCCKFGWPFLILYLLRRVTLSQECPAQPRMDLLESWQREIRSSMAQLARTTDATAAKALRLLPFL